MRKKVGGDAFSGVAYRDFHMRIDLGESHLNASVSGSELDGVRKEVPEDLLKAVSITPHKIWLRIQHGLQFHAFGLGCRADRVEGVVDEFTDFDRRHVESQLAGNDP